MKKILSIAIIFIAGISLISCNSMERKAKSQLRSTLEELAKNPESFSISKEKVVFINDSMCTISFIGRGQNGFGGYTSSKMEYTLLKLENRERGTQYDEALLDMEDRDQRKGSIKEALENVDGGYLYGTEKDVYNECLRNCGGDKEKARADYLFSRALCNVISNGRVVDSDD